MKRAPKVMRRTTWILALAVVLLLAVMTLLIVKLEAYRTPELSAEDKLKQTMDAVGAKAVLPVGEMPTIATVTDPSKLRDQPFFAEAQVGDQVLIYPTSKRAVLWRPSQGKVVEIASLNVSLPQPPLPISTSTKK